ncbi:MAG: hypothetical protein MJ231_08760 [bacterium]|nr:hypothetical protein [bacterium]
MLKLRHILDKTCLALYEDFICDWQQTLNSYREGNLYVIPIPENTVIVLQGTALFSLLEEFSTWTAADFYCSADELQSFVKNLEKTYPALGLLKDDIHKEKSQIEKVLDFLFIKKGYGNSRFDKVRGALFDDAPIDTCPYCNRHFIKTILTPNSSVVRGQLDHFYAKDKYPYLALHLYNLVPSCYNCNHGKSDVGGDLVSPYSLQTSDGLHFFAHIKNSSIFSLSSFENGIDIDVDVQSNAPANLSNNITAFHLQEIYRTHKDFVAELYVKSKLKMNQAYARSIMRYYKGRSFRLTASDQKRLITGVYTDEKDYGKRPLSKFCTDIAKQFGLI